MSEKDYQQMLEKYRNVWRLINIEYLDKEYKSNIFGQGKMLNVLFVHDGVISQKQLAEKMNITPPSLSELLDKCEKNGYIERFKDDNDKRRTFIKMTSKAHELLNNNMEIRQNTSNKIFSLLTREENEVFEKILDKLFLKLSKEKGV